MTGKTVVAGIGGFFVGLLALVIVIVAVVLGFSGIILSQMLDADPPQGIQIEGNNDLGTVSDELGLLLAEMGINQGISLSEDALMRLGAAALGEVDSDDYFSFAYLSIDIEPGAFIARLSGTVTPDIENPLDARFGEIPLSASLEMSVSEEDDSLTLRLEDVFIGRYRLPLGVVRRLGRLDQVLEESSRALQAEAGILFERDLLSITIPYSIIEQSIGAVGEVTSIRAGTDELYLGLSLAPALGGDLVNELAEVVAKDGDALISVVERNIPDQRIVSRTRELVNSIQSSPILQEPGSSVPTALVSFADGLVYRIMGNEQAEVIIGEEVEVGSTIETGEGSSAELILPNQSIIRMAENTRFEIELMAPSAESGETTLNLVSGRLRSVVNRLGPDSSYNIRTGSAVAGVRGTDFVTARLDDGGVDVLVLEGTVAVESPETDEIEVEAGEKISASEEDFKEGGTGIRVVSIPARESREIEENLMIRTSPGQADEIRQDVLLWQVVEYIIEISPVVASLPPAAQAGFAQNLIDQTDILNLLDSENVQAIVDELESLGVDTSGVNL